jgi:hypothetical protein
MSYFARRRGRDSRSCRPAASGWLLETLEGRTMLSSSGGATSIPTTTVLQTSTTSAETSQAITFTAAVENANRNIPVTSGRVKFVVDSPKRIVLAEVNLNKRGEAGITTDKLTKVGVYVIDAVYVPHSSQTSKSLSTPITVTVNPLTASSFLVTPDVRHGHLGQAMSFTVTALNGRREPLTNYTGTIALSSPTDSWTTFPRGVYISLGISAPPPQSTGLAAFPSQNYTFTPADHGTHNFIGAVMFNKGGAEILKVTQANNAKVFGKTTFAIS